MRIFLCIFLFNMSLVFASDECVKKGNCSSYQIKKIGPNYQFSFLESVVVKDSDLKDGDLSGAYITPSVRMNLSNKKFINSYWKTYFVQGTVTQSDFSGSYMRGFVGDKTIFYKVNFENVDFFGSSFSLSTFNETNLKNVDFSYSDLSFARFKNSDLRGVNFSNCNLLGSAFLNSKIDNTTKFPKDFDKTKVIND